MSRLIPFGVVVFFVGCCLLLAELRWFRRRSLVERLAPYLPGAGWRSRPPTSAWPTSWRAASAPLARALGDRIAQTFGVTEPLHVRLQRLHSPEDPASFRLRQAGWVAGGFAAGAAAAVMFHPRGLVTVVLLAGGSLLGFLTCEQRLAGASRARQDRLKLELPVVAEQLGLLIGAGYSLGTAIRRLAGRGSGACSQDLGRVAQRIRMGLSEEEALREWAEIAAVDAVHRLVGVLALNHHAADLGRLISDEARSLRRELHHELLATVERRSQQVWVPVTVATLVPGAMFLAVPFVDALRLFAGA